MTTGVEQLQGSPAAIEDRCLRCGYDLRGLADDQPCSECGLLAERSRNQSKHLADAPPWLIRRLSTGVSILLCSVMCMVGWTILLMAGQAILNAVNPSGSAHLVFLGFDVGVIGWTVGAWLLMTRGTSAHSACMPKRLRRWFRFSTMFGLVVLGTFHAYLAVTMSGWLWNTGFRSTRSWAYFVVHYVPYLLVGLAWLAFSLNSVFGFLWLRRLAVRVLDSNLAEHSAIVGAGLATSLGLLIVSALASSWIEEAQWMRPKTRMNLSMVLLVFNLALLMTCLLWSLVNLIRFTLAFRRAARESATRWNLADRAATEIS